LRAVRFDRSVKFGHHRTRFPGILGS